MKATAPKKPHGQLRQSQVITTFGPGALLDLPKDAVLVGGLEFWSDGVEVREPRLVEKLQRLLQVPRISLRTPPPDLDDPTGPRSGIAAWRFPEWFIVQDLGSDIGTETRRARPLVPASALTKRHFIDKDKKRRPVVPIRFVRGCRRGHIGDVDWRRFVRHVGDQNCRRPLWLVEVGTSGDLSEISVRCDCGGEREMRDATIIDLMLLGRCDGARPWLGPMSSEDCDENNRLLIRTASNSYFPQIMSVISLPLQNEELASAVDRVWEHYLQYVDAVEDLQRERKKPPVRSALEGFSDQDVFREIESRRGTQVADTGKPVKQAELEVLLASEDELGEDKPDGDFFARSLPEKLWSGRAMSAVEKVVLVHRLREVVAEVGFTRFEPASPDIEGELEMGVRRAALARELTWLPSVENKGEGVLIVVKHQAIEDWLQKPAVRERGKQLAAGFECWRTDHHGTHRKFPGLPYVMLHSLSHLLLTAIALECGYPASSLRERVYAGSAGYAILLHTGSPGAEGTLGGLAEAGRRIRIHVQTALRSGVLCSNDPVCSQHDPENPHERRFLLGAACHGCLLIAETSCEQHNDFLDRTLVVTTVSEEGSAFFAEST